MSLKKAMILAAGFGTRLLPLTETIPKALVPLNGKPMIEHVINRLIDFGIDEITVNSHHYSSLLKDYFERTSFTAKINLVIENEILGTGGGIKNAGRFLENAGAFIVYNVDVLSDFKIQDMFAFHLENGPVATLAVKQRRTTRPLLFDKENNLVGRVSEGKRSFFKNNYDALAPGSIEKAFCGIHILSSGIFKYFPKENNFDIIDYYMNLTKKGVLIKAYDIAGAHWEDLGKYKK